MELLQFIANLLQGITSWFPRPVYCPISQADVVWTGKRDPVVKQGLWVHVPLFQEKERIDLRDQPIEFEPKTVWTKDGKTVAVGMVVIWFVEDALLCGTTVDEVDSLVPRSGESVLPETVGAFVLNDFKRKAIGGEGREWAFDTHLRTALSALVKPYGVGIRMARLNFTDDRVRTFKLIGNDLQKTPRE